MSLPALTEDEFKKVLPSTLRRNVNPVVLDHINDILANDDIAETFRENLLSYTGVIRDGKFKIESYVNAVKYVSHKLLGKCNRDAYHLTFPVKYARLVARGASEKDIAAYVAAYNKGKLVNLIFEQTLIPTHILNAHLFQEALNTQASLMMSAKSEKVRSDAANSLLTHLKRPEAQKVELDLNISEDSTIQALRDSTLELVKQQKQMLENQLVTAQQVAEADIIEITAEVV